MVVISDQPALLNTW